MSSVKISAISVQEITEDEEIEGNSQKEEEKNNGEFTLTNIFEALGILGFGVIGFSLLFTIPWTSIPRTDSIIYQSHWMEVLLPSSSLIFFDCRITTFESNNMDPRNNFDDGSELSEDLFHKSDSIRFFLRRTQRTLERIFTK